MFNRTVLKDTFREIWQTISRFLSILAIIFVGVSFFAGLVATSPVMRETANTYFEENNLSDIEMISPLGFNEDDKELLESMENETLEFKSMVDVLVNKNEPIRLYGYDDSDELNQWVVTEGELPKASNEIVLDDNDEMRELYSIGDTFTVETDNDESYVDSLTELEFEVVGFANSPAYIDKNTRGNTNIGSGIITGFAIVQDEVIDADDMIAEISFAETDGSMPVYSSAYENFVDDKVQTYEEAFDGRVEDRHQEMIDEANQELDDARAEINDAKEQLADGRKQLEDAKAELGDTRSQLEAQQQELNTAKAQFGSTAPAIVQAELELKTGLELLNQAEAEYEANLAQFEEEEANAQAEIEDGEGEIADGEAEVADLEDLSLSVTVNSALDYPGLQEYGENANRMEAISRIFPVFFFALALLISLTTMSRMVDENRTQIGTMKALGYNNIQISVKYFTYALIATMAGSVLGLALGFWLFPSVIVNAYGTQYQLIEPQLSFYPWIALIAFLGAFLATAMATFMSLRNLLKNNAATLLRPKAPKSGQRILLERMSFIWDRLSFVHKVSIRNLFRYKGRMIMTIIGVSGGVALMLTGFGLSDSIIDVGDIQFDEILAYDMMTIVDSESSDEAIQEVDQTLENLDEVKDLTNVSSKMVTTSADDKTHNVTIMVPEDETVFEDYIHLRDYDSKEPLAIPEEGAIITKKLAMLLDVEPGMEITIEDSDENEYTVPIEGVAEHYVNHNLYLSPDTYETIFDEIPTYDTRLVHYNQSVSKEDEEAIEDQLFDQEATMAVVFQSENSEDVDEALASLDVVTLVLIISAGILAFVVLYNLTNINVSERIKELSTIKVLGFYDREVTRYVYRETFTLSVMGIIVGLGLGVLLHQFVLRTVELDMVMFGRSIHLSSHLYATGLMILFSISVMIFMHFKLKKVNMVEALKASD